MPDQDEPVVAYLAQRVEALEAEIARLTAAGGGEQPGLIVKDDGGQRLVFGWWYQSHGADGTQWVDYSGDVVDDPEEIEKTAYKFMVDRRTGDVMHEGRPVATVVESAVFTPDKLAKMKVPEGVMPTGWWGGMKVHDDGVWDGVRSGRFSSFSIGGKGRRKSLG